MKYPCTECDYKAAQQVSSNSLDQYDIVAQAPSLKDISKEVIILIIVLIEVSRLPGCAARRGTYGGM